MGKRWSWVAWSMLAVYLVGMVALSIILFDGGLRTSFDDVRATWRPALRP